MRDDLIFRPAQCSTASKAGSLVKSTSKSPGHSRRLFQPSWHMMGSPLTVRTRLRYMTWSPGRSSSIETTSGGAARRCLTSTCVTKSLPCSWRDAANEIGRSPAGCEIPASATKVPDPRTWVRRPSSTRDFMARRTVPRLRSKESMSSCSEGMRLPGVHSRE